MDAECDYCGTRTSLQEARLRVYRSGMCAVCGGTLVAIPVKAEQQSLFEEAPQRPLAVLCMFRDCGDARACANARLPYSGWVQYESLYTPGEDARCTNYIPVLL